MVLERQDMSSLHLPLLVTPPKQNKHRIKWVYEWKSFRRPTQGPTHHISSFYLSVFIILLLNSPCGVPHTAGPCQHGMSGGWNWLFPGLRTALKAEVCLAPYPSLGLFFHSDFNKMLIQRGIEKNSSYSKLTVWEWVFI